MAKHVFVTGGVASSLGKGITASSLGRLLKARGLRVTMQKLDPYINVDPGTMDPFEHGEVFVTDDGSETDLDLGHYERFVDVALRRNSSVTTGSIYRSVISRERRGDYQGKTVQVIPHVTDEIKSRIYALATDDVDVVITEVGGTVGDIEILPFLEAIRQFRKEVGRDNVCYIHLTLVPYLGTSGEQKTKPTQHSVTELRSRGIQPDVIVCRSDKPIAASVKSKISMLCDVPEDAVVSAIDAKNLYEVPIRLHDEGLDEYVCRLLRFDPAEFPLELDSWVAMTERANHLSRRVRIGIIGKYVNLPDAYLSVAEALRHGGLYHDAAVEIEWISAEAITPLMAEARLSHLDGIVLPGGFGNRGIEGKIAAATYTREHGIPCLGICLGLQTMVIDAARHLCGLEGAHSREFSETTPHPVIDLMEEQREVQDLGGTMRLGAQVARLAPNSRVALLYGEEVIEERHRHRFEVNPRYRARLVEGGLHASGLSPDGSLVEFVELPDHPFWIGTQAHPEFKSRPDRPHPLFRGLIGAAVDRAELRADQERHTASSLAEYQRDDSLSLESR
ncbi:MAG: CTP synthase [Acidimicrobiales bacterium]